MDRQQAKHAEKILRDYLGPLSEYIEADDIQEIMVNRPGDVWIERAGQMIPVQTEIDDVTIRAAIQVLGRLMDKDATEGTREGIIDTRLGHYRVAAVLAPTAIRGHAMCVRKHTVVDATLEHYVKSIGRDENGQTQKHRRPSREAIAQGDRALVEFLRWAVSTKKNILISGGTSSGKTTLLNALLAEFDENERVVTIEDVGELRVKSPNYVSLETNEQQGIAMHDLLRLALRFRPDRIIVGEIRGAEAFDLLQALNTGHEGGVATLHANSPMGALTRLETLVLVSGVQWPHEAIRTHIAQTVDYIVQMARVGNERGIVTLAAVTGYSNGQYQIEQWYGGRNEQTH